MSARSCGLVLGNTLSRLEREEPELEEVAEFVLGVASWAATFNRFGGEAERTSLTVLFEGWEGGTLGTGACEETGRMGEEGLDSRLFLQAGTSFEGTRCFRKITCGNGLCAASAIVFVTPCQS